MTRYIVHRLLQGIVLLCMVATIVFFLGRLTGNPVDLMLPEDATPEDRLSMIKALGLDGTIYHQFLIFAGNELRALEFADAEACQFQQVCALTFAATQFLHSRSSLLRAAVAFAIFREFVVKPRIAIEDLAMSFCAEQRLLFMLPVNLHQRCPYLA